MSLSKTPWSVSRWSETGGDQPENTGDCYINNGVCDIAYLATHRVDDVDMTEADAILLASAPVLRNALQRMVDRYVSLVNSGDCGFWNPEDESDVIAARNALAQSRGR
jgi:hypothetical protein